MYFSLERKLLQVKKTTVDSGNSEFEQNYILSLTALKLIFDSSWAGNLTLTFQQLIPENEGTVEQRSRIGQELVINFCGYVLSMRYAENFRYWCEKLQSKGLDLRAAYAEAQVAFWFRQHSWQITPNMVGGVKGDSFDFIISHGNNDEEYPVEVTRFDAKAVFTRDRLIGKLRRKRSQLPEDRVGIICLNCPSRWKEDNEAEVREVISEFLDRESAKRIDRIVVFYESWGDCVEKSKLGRVSFSEITRLEERYLIGRHTNPEIYDGGSLVEAPKEMREQVVVSDRDVHFLGFIKASGKDAFLGNKFPPHLSIQNKEEFGLRDGFAHAFNLRLEKLDNHSVDLVAYRVFGEVPMLIFVRGCRSGGGGIGYQLEIIQINTMKTTVVATQAIPMESFHNAAFEMKLAESEILVTFRALGARAFFRSRDIHFDEDSTIEISMGGMHEAEELGFCISRTAAFRRLLTRQEIEAF